MVKTVPLGNSWKKKHIFEKYMIYFEKGYVFSIPSGVRGMF